MGVAMDIHLPRRPLWTQGPRKLLPAALPKDAGRVVPLLSIDAEGGEDPLDHCPVGLLN